MRNSDNAIALPGPAAPLTLKAFEVGDPSIFYDSRSGEVVGGRGFFGQADDQPNEPKQTSAEDGIGSAVSLPAL